MSGEVAVDDRVETAPTSVVAHSHQLAFVEREAPAAGVIVGVAVAGFGGGEGHVDRRLFEHFALLPGLVPADQVIDTDPDAAVAHGEKRFIEIWRCAPDG